MAKKLDCTEDGCKGRVLMSTEVSIQTGCGGCRGRSNTPVHPCDICGFLHFFHKKEGIVSGANNGHQKAFLVKGEVQHRETKEKV